MSLFKRTVRPFCTVTPARVLDFWFGPLEGKNSVPVNSARWFAKSEDFDQEVKGKFLELMHHAASEELAHWKATASGSLALVILLDQFPRNVYRNDPRSFAHYEAATAVTKAAIELSQDQELWPVPRTFLYMPLLHSECLEDHGLFLRKLNTIATEPGTDSAHYIAQTNEFLLQHSRILEAFGRYPHRNSVLNRKSTHSELEFLKTHSGF